MISAKAAVLWDESYLWGLIAIRTLRHKGLLFDILRAEDIRTGLLQNYTLLFVPGGWASHKQKALGETGAEAVRYFVREGGNYLGFCGGAGLATQDGIGLLPITRVPTSERIPSFSGPISCTLNPHPMWDTIYRPIFYAWWPSQFHIKDDNIQVCAYYEKALPTAYSADIRVGSITSDHEWTALEAAYGINLNPARLAGSPAVVEGRYGKGRVLLSLLHFDTPEDGRGNRVLRRLWSDLGGTCRSDAPEAPPRHHLAAEAACLVDEIQQLVHFGEKLGLWHWRNHWALQWKRGVRGFEYCTLANMALAIAEHLVQRFPDGVPMVLCHELQYLAEQCAQFRLRAEKILTIEASCLQKNQLLSFDACDHSALQEAREELFGNAKRYGGAFKALLDKIDVFLYRLLIEQ
jgi:hypothetical protein